MITKTQAIALGADTLREEIHQDGCTCEVVPRGGKTIQIVRVRPNGRCQTWKTRPDEWRLPIKYGLYTYGEITHPDADGYHIASECPLNGNH